MIGVHNQCHVLKTFGLIILIQVLQILIVVVGDGLAMLIHITPEDGMSQGIAGGVHLPATVNKGMSALSGQNGIEHNGNIPAGGVLHTHRNGNAAGGQPVLLIFHAPGPHGHIGQQIGKIPIIVRVQHFIGGGQAGFRQHIGVEPANGNDPLEHVGLALRVWLVKQPLVACACGSGLVGVHPESAEACPSRLPANAPADGSNPAPRPPDRLSRGR